MESGSLLSGVAGVGQEPVKAPLMWSSLPLSPEHEDGASSPDSVPSPATAVDVTLTSYPKGKHTLPLGASQCLRV